MKRSIIIALIISASMQLIAQVPKDAAREYILDYNVPESPAFSILDLNPNEVMRGASAKPVVVNIVNQFASKGSIDNGIAIDFNPYFLLGGQFKGVDEYRNSYVKRLLINTQFSLASLEETDSDNTILAHGIRVTLLDDKDLLRNKELSQSVDAILKPTVVSPGETTNGQVQILESAKLAKAYEDLKAEYGKTSGSSFSLGYAGKSVVQSSILDGDSINLTSNQFWGAGSFTMKGGFDFNVMAVSRMFKDMDNEFKAGASLRYNWDKASFTAEYVFSDNEPNGEKNSLSGIVSIKLIDQISYLLTFGKTKVEAAGEESNKLVLKSSLKWNIGN